MTTTITERASRYLHDAARGVRRAPIEVLATLATAVAFSTAIELGDATFVSFAETAVACLLLIAVAWTGTLLEAMGAWDRARRWAFTAFGSAVVAIYAITVADFTNESEAWRAALLGFAAVAWLFALPAFAGPAQDRVERMRRVDGRILLRMIGALLYGVALFAGLALALRAVDVLFELQLEEDIYAHVWGWNFFVLVPWIVLGGLPDYVRPREESTQLGAVAHRIALYLVPPLLALYYVILFAYVVRIFVTGELPKNLVSPLVLAAGGLGALGLLLFDPRPGGHGVTRWLRIAPPLFLPLAALGVWALNARLDQYGLTEFRVIRLAVLIGLAALAVAASVQLFRRRAFALHWVPLGMAALLLAIAIGPWSAIALSHRSQSIRLNEALREVGIDPEAEPVPAPAYPGGRGYDVVAVSPARSRMVASSSSDTTLRVVPAEAYQRIVGSARYLVTHGGPDELPRVLERIARSDDARWLDYAAALGLRPDAPVDGERPLRWTSLRLEEPVRLAGGTAHRVDWPFSRQEAGLRPGTEQLRPIYDPRRDGLRLAIRYADRVLYADLTRFADLAIALDHAPRPIGADQATIPLTTPAGDTAGTLIVWELGMQTDSAGPRIGNLSGMAVMPE